jgi:hypothetical protein
VFLVDDMGVMDTSVPFLTDEAGRPTRYPLNDYYRTPNMARRGLRHSFHNFARRALAADAHRHHDVIECGAAWRDELDQSEG